MSDVSQAAAAPAAAAVSASESFVQGVWNDINNGFNVLEAEVVAGFEWTINHIGDAASIVDEITLGATTVVTAITANGGTLTPAQQQAIKDLDAATAGLDAAAQAAAAVKATGTAPTIQQIAEVGVAGYQAAKVSLASAQGAAAALNEPPAAIPLVVITPVTGG